MSNKCIYQFIEKEAKTFGNRIAIECQCGKSITYINLLKLIEEFKKTVHEWKLNETYRVAVISNSGFDIATLFFPVSKYCIFIPLNPQFSREELKKYLNLLKVDIIMVSSNYGGLDLKIWDGPVIRYTLEDNFQFEIKNFENYIGNKPYQYSDIAMILTTSGTTSTPKVVPLTYKNIMVSALEKIGFFDFKREDRNLIITPVYRGNSINSMLATIMSGGTVIIADGFNHVDFIKLIRERTPTWFTASPAVLNSLVQYGKEKNLDFGNSLRFLRSSGAPLNKDTKEYLEREFKVPVIQTYGMTETRTIASNYGLPVYKEGSVGISIGSSIKIEDGEILIKGENVFKGYEDNTEANINAFREGWFRTGDIGYIDDDGYVFITGRLKEMINKGGEKISPYEVEESILSKKGILNVAIFPYPNKYGSEDVGAAIVLEEGYSIDLKELREFLLGKMSSYKMPTLLYLVDEIPLSTSNKLQRKSLFNILDSKYSKVKVEGNSIDKYNNDFDLNDIERRLISIWKKILNVKNISIDDDFFALGGDSLAASVLFAEIEEEFQVQLSIDELFQKKSIREFSRIIKDGKKRNENFNFLVRIKDGKEKIPIFFIHSVSGEVVIYHEISENMKENRKLFGLKYKTDEDWNYPLDLDQLAYKYIEEMKKIYPTGPFKLCGDCYGGILAYKIGCILKKMGEEVSFLAMIDPIVNKKSVNKADFSINKKIWYAFVDIKEVGFRGIPSFIREKARNLNRIIKLKKEYRTYINSINNKKKIPNNINKEIILKEAKKHTKFEPFDGRAYYLLPRRTSKGSLYSINYWNKKIKDLKIIEFNGSHNFKDAKDLAGKIEDLLE